jgi:5-methylthioadenosine/S-adenosylhomocysteine deaminase
MTSPRSNVVFNLVYYATGGDVDSVVIDGRLVMERRRVLTVDEGEVLTRVQEHAERLWRQAAS